MNLKEFRKYVKNAENGFLNRTELINRLIPIKKDWSYIIRSLLFASNSRLITNRYLLQKIDFMIENPDKMYAFLDNTRELIYIILKDYLEKK